MQKPIILCLAALPPPYHGVSVANDLLLNNPDLHNRYDIRIISLNKPKLQFGGRFALIPLAEDISVTLTLLKSLIRTKPAITYLGLAHTRLGLWRDLSRIWLATLAGCKCLIHTHGGNYRNFYEDHLSLIEKKFYRRILSEAHGIIVLDPSLGYLFRGLVPEDRIFSLRNGIPDILSDTTFPQVLESRKTHEKIEVSYLSNLLPGKGFDIFLETAAWLKNKGEADGFRFHLAGASPSPEVSAQVEEYLGHHGLEQMVRLWGKVLGAEKRRFLLESDIFVFPSSYMPEGQPFVIIEAMAAGLPVIASPRGAIPAMVQEGVNGFLVSEGAPAEIAQRLQLLRDNALLRISMSQASRKRYLEHYTEEKFVGGFLGIVKKILQGGWASNPRVEQV